MKLILTIIFLTAWIICGIGLERTGEFGNAFFAFYGAVAVYAHLSIADKLSKPKKFLGARRYKSG